MRNHAFAALILVSLAAAACSDREEGPATKAGQAVDQAGQNVKDAIDPGPAQKAGRSIDRALGN
ncbi:MAG: hypothetical protein JO110_30305 [Acetobacteraceae bacterium]|nr:hypothetical protein [Acetobacteraceae bacterium]